MVTEVNASNRKSKSSADGKSKAKSEDRKSKKDENEKPPQTNRETVESIVVAFILAFLFRAFVAEAFVIPTGSMAPTLMGAHKDLVCEHCGEQYQASGSMEYDKTGALISVKSVASTCSNCRGLNVYDFENNKNHTTFSGDRILVSKFDYVLGKPKRWDVIVFKYPQEAHMNYIKRLIGLPGENLRIVEGDIYVEGKDGSWIMARKPPHKVQAMKQVVYNTDHIPQILFEKGWPTSWQPWTTSAGGPKWRVEVNDGKWTASLTATPNEQWIRYYHKFIDRDLWDDIYHGKAEVPQVAPTFSRLITDFVAYNTPYRLEQADVAFNLEVPSYDRYLPPMIKSGPTWVPDGEKPDDVSIMEYVRQKVPPRVQWKRPIQVDHQNGSDGFHWVGDLIGDFDVAIESDTGTLLLDLVEFGVHYRCAIDVSNGQATLQAVDGSTTLPVFGGQSKTTAQTRIKGKGRHSLQFANVDDQLLLWVDKKLVEFDQPTTFDAQSFREGDERRPYWTEQDPLDAAPLGIGGIGLGLTVKRAKVFRDIYYIARQGLTNTFTDYLLGTLADAVPDKEARNQLRNDSAKIISAVYKHPEWWASTNLFAQRKSLTFQLDEKQYFPLGDNSAASADARIWRGLHFVEERFLLGKALLVFWPHTWKTPVPFTPNLQRMGFIR